MDDGSRDRPGGAAAPRVIGKVIRSDGSDLSSSGEKAAPRRAGVVNAEEFEARTKAKEIIAAAERRAEEIKSEAAAAREDVFAKAREAAIAQVQAQSTEELARAKLQVGQLIDAAEGDIVSLSLKIAAKIIGRELEHDPDLVLEIAANVIQTTRAGKALILRVHPEDAKLLRLKKPKLLELVGRSIDVAIRDDGDVERGGCMVQTEFGVIDGQIRTQFEMLENVFKPEAVKKESK
jgi:type III secretion protein L